MMKMTCRIRFQQEFGGVQVLGFGVRVWDVGESGFGAYSMGSGAESSGFRFWECFVCLEFREMIRVRF